MTESQMNGCWAPLVQAVVARYGVVSGNQSKVVTMVTMAHEFTGIWALECGSGANQPWTPSQSSTFIHTLSVAARAANPNVKVGVGMLYGEGSYISNWLTNNVADLDYVGFDIYAVVNPAVYGTGPLTQFATWAAEIIAAGLFVVVDEANPPVHVLASASSDSENNALEGCGWYGWDAFGTNQRWSDVLRRWASAQGISYVSVYATGQHFYTTTSTGALANCTNSATTGTFYSNLIPNLGFDSQTGIAYGKAAAGSSMAIQ